MSSRAVTQLMCCSIEAFSACSDPPRLDEDGEWHEVQCWLDGKKGRDRQVPPKLSKARARIGTLCCTQRGLAGAPGRGFLFGITEGNCSVSSQQGLQGSSIFEKTGYRTTAHVNVQFILVPCVVGACRPSGFLQVLLLLHFANLSGHHRGGLLSPGRPWVFGHGPWPWTVALSLGLTFFMPVHPSFLVPPADAIREAIATDYHTLVLDDLCSGLVWLQEMGQIPGRKQLMAMSSVHSLHLNLRDPGR